MWRQSTALAPSTRGREWDLVRAFWSLGALSIGLTTGVLAYVQAREIADRPAAPGTFRVAWHFQWFHAFGLLLPFIATTVLAALSLLLARRWREGPLAPRSSRQRLLATMSILAFGCESVGLIVWAASHTRSAPDSGLLVVGLIGAGLVGVAGVMVAGWTLARNPLRPTATVAVCAVVAVAALATVPLAASRSRLGMTSSWAPVSWDWSYRNQPAADSAYDYVAVQCEHATCLAFGAGIDPSLTGVESGDGGQSWSDLDAVAPSRAPLFVPDSLSCWAATACLAIGWAVPAGRVMMRSTDSGRSWEPDLVAGMEPSDVSCVAGGRCVASGVSTAALAGGVADRYSVIDVSPDGGNTWLGASLPAGRWQIGSVDCPTAASCWAVGLDITRPQQEVPGLLASGDGGRTWRSVPVPSDAAEVGPLSCADARHCVVETFVPGNPHGSGVQGTVGAIATSDGGRTWSATTITHDAQLAPLRCPTIDDCLMAVESDATFTSAVYASTTGGRTWHLQAALRPPGLEVQSVSCASVTGCILAGNEGSGPPNSRGVLLEGGITGSPWRVVHLAK